MRILPLDPSRIYKSPYLLNCKLIGLFNLADNVLIKSAAPNPFNAQIKIFYQISSAEDVVISIHDNLGNKILQHKKQNHSGGFHTFIWNGKNNLGVDVSSGVYIFSITSSLEIKTKKLVYLK